MTIYPKKIFTNYCQKLVNEVIQINQGGPERSHGILLAVQSDFLILLTEDDGVVYVKLHHIKSVSKTGSPEDKKDERKHPRILVLVSHLISVMFLKS